MTDPTTFTVHRALDTTTTPATLHAMATQRPDLRQFVAANPNTPPEVLTWLGQLGDAAVDAALHRRNTAQAPSAIGTGYDAHSNPYAALPPTPPANPYATPTGGAPGQIGGPGPVGGPAAQPYGAPANPYSASAPATSGKRTGLIVALVGVGILAIIAIAIVVVWNVVGGAVRTGIDVIEEQGNSLLQGETYGDNPELDAMWDGCAAGDGAACDDLYLNSEFGTQYEEFGNTCGGRFEADTVWCDRVM